MVYMVEWRYMALYNVLDNGETCSQTIMAMWHPMVWLSLLDFGRLLYYLLCQTGEGRRLCHIVQVFGDKSDTN